jgi:hypothetical protein
MFWIGYPCSSGPLERDDGVQKRLGCFLADDGLPHWGGPGVCLVCLVLRWRDGFGSWAQDPEAVCVSGVIRPPAEKRPPVIQADRQRRLEATGVSDDR